MTNPTKNNLAQFSAASPIILTPWPNGGWTVECAGPYPPGVSPSQLGAFSSHSDMLMALSNALDFQRDDAPDTVTPRR